MKNATSLKYEQNLFQGILNLYKYEEENSQDVGKLSIKKLLFNEVGGTHTKCILVL